MGVLVLVAMITYTVCVPLVAWLLGTEALFDPALGERMGRGFKTLLIVLGPLSLAIGIVVVLLLTPSVLKRQFQNRGKYYTF